LLEFDLQQTRIRRPRGAVGGGGVGNLVPSTTGKTAFHGLDLLFPPVVGDDLAWLTLTSDILWRVLRRGGGEDTQFTHFFPPLNVACARDGDLGIPQIGCFMTRFGVVICSDSEFEGLPIYAKSTGSVC
jgi:hypothetical protein